MMSKPLFSWVGIPVLDLDRAIAFYAAILESTVDKVYDHGCLFGVLPYSHDNVSGCLSLMTDREPSQNGPLIYLNVDGKLDRILDAAIVHGGKILATKENIKPCGQRAIILDTEGNAIALYSRENELC